jgi:LytS/YehU family sensor histidine kinase
MLFWLSSSLILLPLYFINVYYFIPRFLVTERYWSYACLIILSCLAGLLIYKYAIHPLFIFGDAVHFPVPDPPQTGVLQRLPKEERPLPPAVSPFSMVMYLAIGTSFELILNREDQKKEREKIEKEKVLTELSFLRSQINPHFLFNTLNNIYSLAEKGSDKTGGSILMLSSLMRYMLYESNHGKIDLRKEIEYLQNYIAIQRLRISPGQSVTITFVTEGHIEGIMIEPLIFIGFVENAFKHGVSYKYKSIVRINLLVEPSRVKLIVYNTKRPSSPLISNEKGIGLANAHRRLDLLYKDSYELLVQDNTDFFQIDLTLYLKH